MRIGIITFWGVPNYGAFLQAYALKNSIQSLIKNAEVQVIPYLNKYHYSQYYKIIPPFKFNSIIQLDYYRNLYHRYKIKKTIKDCERNFIPEYIKLSEENRISPNELKRRKYDIIILGSDIIWDYTIPFFGRDLFLFGNQFNANKIISYAASFGTAPLNETPPLFVQSGINKLEAISVRDEKSEKIIIKYFNKKAKIVPDPTLLWDFNNDYKFNKPNKWGDYIIIYGSHFSTKLINEAIIYAKQNKLKLICLDSGGDNYSWCDITIKQDNLTPYEWGSIYKNAKYVMTCTFHGLLFGLIFKKPIAFELTNFIRPKVSSIINNLNIEEPLIHLTTFEDKISWHWDYENISNSISRIRENGLSFLEQNIIN